LRNLLKQAGISEAEFMDCLKNQTVLDGVNWVHDRAEKQFGVNATPTFFVNGKMYPGEQALADLDKLLGG
jgi:protein-disulfide isomerase